MSRSSRKYGRRRRLNVESLSERICLAVDAAIDANGLLTIRGIEDDDSAWIRDDGQGTVQVRDLDTGQTWRFGDVQSVLVTTAEGDDSVKYRRESGPAPLPGLTFETGAGSDSLDVQIKYSRRGDSAQALDLDIRTDAGDDDVTVGLLLPAVQKVREAAARTTADLGDGLNRFQLHSAGVGQVGLDLTTGENDDEILIGLLLPAVQKVREAAETPPPEPDVDLNLKTNGGDDEVLIGMLLPAVQKVRDAAARTTADLGDGLNRFELHSAGVGQVGLDLTTGENDDEILIGLLLPAVLKVREGAETSPPEPDVDLNLKTNGGDDEVLIGMLLPAVQKVREAAARTTADLGDGLNRFELQSKGVGQVGLDLTTGEDSDEILIGLLLPAVQKVREAAETSPPEPDVDLALKTNGGDDDVTVGLLLPAVQKVREAAARMEVNMGEGDDRFDLRAIGLSAVDTTLVLGSGADDASISLLLPAVQKVRESVARTDVDTGLGADHLRLRIRGYETVETEIESDSEDSIDDGSAHDRQRLRR